ncbi:MAG: aldehyde dehydrogenase family protein, partial [Actinomycetota bacterium]|nr:aldehyde dehydrogenase family protein [Actinomycetota bacterium]
MSTLRGGIVFEEYRPLSYSDFSEPVPAGGYRDAVEKVGGELGVHAPLVIGGDRVVTDRVIRSVDPSRPDRLVGTASSATSEHAVAALAAAWVAYPGWSGLPAVERAELMHRVGDLIAERIYEFAAWQTFEAGKNWAEAEADVAEAIDFCRYYAHQALVMDEPVAVYSYPGEVNESWLQPIGAGVVIPPWNFPLAILVGMTVGPVAAGNTVVLKPASNTPMVGWGFMQILEQAGVPAGVVNFLPGPGSEVGDTLVDHESTRFVNFTGSKEVGLRIAERSSRVHDGQKWMKRSYMEMGGKDALIVDETADLEAAADDAVRSAFGFQGQKCSACSRLIVVDSIHDSFVDKVVERTAELTIGAPSENFQVGPVVSEAQYRAILEEIELGKAEGTLVLGGDTVDIDGGYYIAPTIFVDVDRDARLAQHEIFGPVLSIVRAADFDDALAIANGTEYGLTGGLHSVDEGRIERAKQEFYVGNLYINRKIT